MSDKGKRILELMGKVQLDWRIPEYDASLTLLEQGMLCVLGRRLTAQQASGTLKSLRDAYPDWNELRVAQVQEFVQHVKSKKQDLSEEVGRDVRGYLNEIYWKNHGFDLEYLRDDINVASKFAQDLPYLGAGPAHYLLWVASGCTIGMSTGVVRALDRLDLLKRTGSLRKAAEALMPLVPKDRGAEFSAAFGEVVQHWCDARKPRCWECPLLAACPHGVKVHKDWVVQQARLEAQRKKDDARNAAQEARDEARRLREEERRRKHAEKETKRLQREAERQQKLKEKRREEEERKKAAAAKKAADAKAKAAEAKKAAAAKKAEERKAAAAKKAEAKKLAAQKAAAAKQAAAKKKGAAPKAAKKATKKSGAKPAAKKSSSGKKSAAKPAASASSKKSGAKKPTTKKPAAKKPATKKPAAKKSTKKPAPKKPATKSKTSKKTTRRGR